MVNLNPIETTPVITPNKIQKTNNSNEADLIAKKMLLALGAIAAVTLGIAILFMEAFAMGSGGSGIFLGSHSRSYR